MTSMQNFKIIDNLEQGTEEWLLWRQGGFGASDAPLFIHGKHFERTYEGLIRQYITGKEEVVKRNTFIMEKGKRFEPIAREWYEKKYKVTAPPICCQSLAHPHIRASLDGFIPHDLANPSQGGIILEIKFASRDDHLLALDNQVTPKYTPQLLHQCLATGCTKVHYVSGNPNFDLAQRVTLVRFSPDQAQLDLLLARINFSWQAIQEKRQVTFQELCQACPTI